MGSPGKVPLNGCVCKYDININMYQFNYIYYHLFNVICTVSSKQTAQFLRYENLKPSVRESSQVAVQKIIYSFAVVIAAVSRVINRTVA